MHAIIFSGKTISSVPKKLLGPALCALLATSALVACGSNVDPQQPPEGQGGTGGQGGVGGQGGGGEPFCVPLPEGAPAVLASLSQPSNGFRQSLVLEGKNLYALGDGALHEVPIDGSGAKEVAKDPTIPADVPFVVSKTEAFYVGTDWNLRRIPLAGGPSSVVAQVVDGAVVLAIDAAQSKIYWLDWDQKRLVSLSLAGGAPEPLCALGDVAGISSIVPDADGTVYALGTGPEFPDATNVIVRCEPGAASVEQVVKLPATIDARFAIDEQFVYFSDISLQEGGIKRVAKDGGGNPMTLDAGGFGPILATAEGMYWARGNSTVIESLDHPTCSPRPIAELQTEHGTFADFTADAERLYALANDGQIFALPR